MIEQQIDLDMEILWIYVLLFFAQSAKAEKTAKDISERKAKVFRVPFWQTTEGGRSGWTVGRASRTPDSWKQRASQVSKPELPVSLQLHYQ
jgi:hypothetical protein